MVIASEAAARQDPYGCLTIELVIGDPVVALARNLHAHLRRARKLDCRRLAVSANSEDEQCQPALQSQGISRR